MNVIHIGSNSEYVEIRLPSSYSSDGWAQAEVEIAVRCFHGCIQPWVEATDFENFTVQLRALYESLQGEAEFCPLEQQFVLKLVGKTGGHIQLAGEAWSQATHQNKLTYEIELDQSFLQEPLRELERLLNAGANHGA
jgi:hypothetical protein